MIGALVKGFMMPSLRLQQCAKVPQTDGCGAPCKPLIVTTGGD